MNNIDNNNDRKIKKKKNLSFVLQSLFKFLIKYSNLS